MARYKVGDKVVLHEDMGKFLGIDTTTIAEVLPYSGTTQYFITDRPNFMILEPEIIGYAYKIDEGYQIKTTGHITEFPSGAVRDSAVGKARMELLPMDLLKRVAIWYGLGAEKYGDNNWRKGQAKSHVMGSLMRHLTAYQMGKTDEDHLSAVIWNALCLMNTDEYLSDNKEINNTEWFTDGIPNGKGAK